MRASLLDHEQQEALRREGNYYQFTDNSGSVPRMVPKSYFKKSLDGLQAVDWKDIYLDDSFEEAKRSS